jgi:NAD(P)-dependent dehydrogenase (short-subunit alcohol dehydrogenase family)
MDVRLTGQVLIVTGGTLGVGEAISVRAALAGAEAVVITGRNAKRGGMVARALRTAGAKALFVAADLADPQAPGRIAEAAIATFGRIDGLVNAAGLTDRGDITDADVALWEKLFAVNARAPFFLMQAAIRDMLSRAAGGSIVNILSMNAHCGIPELAVYSGTKGALATLTKNAANAHLKDRIRVNGIMMGWAATPSEIEMQAVTLGKGAGWEADVTARLPLGRLLTMDEVARQVIWLLSEASGLQTGTLIDLEQRVTGA